MKSSIVTQGDQIDSRSASKSPKKSTLQNTALTNSANPSVPKKSIATSNMPTIVTENFRKSDCSRLPIKNTYLESNRVSSSDNHLRESRKGSLDANSDKAEFDLEDTSDENRNEKKEMRTKTDSTTSKRYSNSSIPVSNMNNLDFIKQKLSNKSTSSYNKQERDIYLRNSLRSSGHVSKVKQYDSPISPSLQKRQNNQTKLKSEKKDLYRSNEAGSPKNVNYLKEKEKPLGAVASLAQPSMEIKKKSEYTPYKNKYLNKKENHSQTKNIVPNIENFPNTHEDKLEPEVNISNSSLAFIDLKCCKRIPSPPDMNIKQKLQFTNSFYIDDAASENSSFSTSTLDSGISSHDHLNQEIDLSLEVENLENCESEMKDTISPSQTKQIEYIAFEEKPSLEIGNEEDEINFVINDISSEIANLQLDLLAEVEKISQIETPKQDSFESNDYKSSSLDFQEDISLGHKKQNEEIINPQESSKVKRVSTYAQIFCKGNSSAKIKPIKKSVSVGKEIDDQHKSNKLDQEKEKNVFKSVFSKRRNIFEKKVDSKAQDKSQLKKSLIPSVHSSKDSAKTSHNKFGFSALTKNIKSKEERNSNVDKKSTPKDQCQDGKSNPSSPAGGRHTTNIPKQCSPKASSLVNSPRQTTRNRLKSDSSSQDDSPVRQRQISDNLLLEITDALHSKKEDIFLSTSKISPQEEEERQEFLSHNMNLDNKNDENETLNILKRNSSNVESITSDTLSIQSGNVSLLLKTFDGFKPKENGEAPKNNIEIIEVMDTVKKGKINALISKFESNS